MEKYPNITDSYIRSLTDKAITYAKGKDYYEKNFITSLRESRDRHTFDAEVAGTDFYAVHLEFRGNKLAVCDCDCPAFSKYDGACKHIIATLFKVQELARADATHTHVNGADFSHEITACLYDTASISGFDDWFQKVIPEDR